MVLDSRAPLRRGRPTAPRRAGRPGHPCVGRPERLRSLLLGAGCGEPRIDEVSAAWTFRDDDEYWTSLEGLAGAISMVLARLDATERSKLRAEISMRVEAHRTADGISQAATSLVATARAESERERMFH